MSLQQFAYVFIMLTHLVPLSLFQITCALLYPLPSLFHSAMNFIKQTFVHFTMFLSAILCPFEIHLSGHQPNPTENAILISNHQTLLDWMYFMMVAEHFKATQNIKIIAKDQVKYLPIVGWGMILFDFMFLKRKWAEDKERLIGKLMHYVKSDYPFWLVLFPEGTVLCEETRGWSRSFADKMGFVVPKNVLLPKTTGLFVSARILREAKALEALYNCTLAFEGDLDGKYPYEVFTPFNVYGKRMGPRVVHIHLERIQLKELPEMEEEFGKYTRDLFYEKDTLLDRFEGKKSFSDDSIVIKVIPKVRFILVLWTISAVLAAMGFCLIQYLFK